MIRTSSCCKLLLVLVLLPSVLVSVSCEPERSETKTELRIVDTRFMGLLPLYVAAEKGYFDQVGLDIEWIEVRDPGQASRTFFAGDADLLMTTFANILPAESQQRGSVRLLLPAFESSTRPGSYLLVRPTSEIRNLGDLRGKSVGTYSGPSQKAYALMFLRKLGYGEPQDVRLVQVATSAQVQSLFADAFDSLFTVEPYGSVAIAQGARVVEEGVRTRYISDPFWIGSAAIRGSFYDGNQPAVSRLIDALSRASDFIEESETEAREILARHTGMTPAVAARCRLYNWVAKPSDTQLEEMQAHADLLLAEGLIEKRVEVRPLFASTPDE